MMIGLIHTQMDIFIREIEYDFRVQLIQDIKCVFIHRI